MRRLVLVLLLAAGAGVERVAAQTPPVGIGSRVGTTSATPSTTPSGYDDGGRRDPFVSLIAPKKTAAAPAPFRPGTGLAAIAVTDVVVKGIIKSGSTLVAILESPDGKGYLARQKDKLQDGVIKSIDVAGVVFTAQVVDETGEVRSREVRKLIRPIVEIGR